MLKKTAERQRERRARLRLDAQSYDVYKAKDHQRKKSWRQQLLEKDLDFLRLRTRVSMHVLWKRRREALPENEAAGLPIEGPLYKCRASFGKLVEGTVENALDNLKGQLPRFLWHNLLKEKQSAAYEEDKIKSGGQAKTNCMVQMDFAENYILAYTKMKCNPLIGGKHK